MQQYQGFTLAFFNEPELIHLFNIVLHRTIKIYPII
jgi:hypothetical protein